MSEDSRLQMSPLCRKISRDGMTIEVLIYRGVDEAEWLLEVVDQEDASTVWEDRFSTDQAALDEVIQTIETEGIGCFLREPAQRLN